MRRVVGNVIVVVLCVVVSVFAVLFSLATHRAQEIRNINAVIEVQDEKSVEQSLVAYGYNPDVVVDSLVIEAAKIKTSIETNEVQHAGIRAAGLTLLAQYVAPPLEYVRVEEGMRVEEVGDELASALDWDETQTEEFVGVTEICSEELREGKLKPATYAIGQTTPPETVRDEMEKTFDESLALIMDETGTPLDERTILTIASLIQREAAGAKDMALISGIIWNRIFMDMSLDIDATLQYAKATELDESGEDVLVWWPRVRSKDKFIDSPFNTYQNEGLPPSPIATPSEEAILAAISPEETECIFYLHDSKRNIHCAKDYAAHKRNVYWYLK